ncbi:MAG TPA: hypothetical protein VHM91_15165 [Verrucomicrobiales bacterium]|jgi:hypothetical protein|nr:hypothetical protein [Verrucomicrobiales bacterium]
MANDKTPLAGGLVGLPRIVEGTKSRYEADVTLDDERVWKVAWDRKTKLATVYDESNTLIGWTERDPREFRQVVLASGEKPAVSMQDGWLSSVVWIDDTKHKAVMMLEGRKRVFGNERLRLEHRDFKSEVRFRCAPGLEVAAVIVAFEVYCSGNCQGRHEV